MRVLEREYPLPSTGEGLLVLIDEPAPGAALPAVGIHTLAAPVHVRPPIDCTLDKPARLALMRAASRAEHVGRAIAVHPAVQAFWAGGSGDRAT